jgi:hypothetical protein
MNRKDSASHVRDRVGAVGGIDSVDMVRAL